MVIRKQTERKEQADRMLATLGLFKFAEKQNQKAIIEDAIKKITEAEAAILKAESMYKTQLAEIEESVKKMEPSIRNAAERFYIFPVEPTKPQLKIID